MSSNGTDYQSWGLTSIKDARVIVTPIIKGAKPDYLIDSNVKTRILFKKLNKTTIKIEFKQARIIQAIGVLRPGWSSWAIPKTILIKVDNQKQRRVILKSSRISPNTKNTSDLKADIIRISNKPVRVIEIVIVETEAKSRYNTLGTIELCEAIKWPDAINFSTEGVPANAKGINFKLYTEAPVKQAKVEVFTGNRPFERISAQFFTAMICDLKKGENSINIYWEQFGNTNAPQLKLNPFSIYKIEIENEKSSQDPVVLKSWNFISGENNLKPAWEKLRSISHKADADGWRMGIPSFGFGRFGWAHSNGLLVGKIEKNTFSYMQLNKVGYGRLLTFTFDSSNGDKKMQWDRLYANWTGVVHQMRMGPEDKKLLAPEDKKKEKEKAPVSLIYSILAPGFLIDSAYTKFSFGNETAGTPSLLYVGSKGLQWASKTKVLSGKDMAEGWLVAVWPKQPYMPVMFTLKHRPKTITIAPTLIFEFEKSVGRLGVGTPSGFRWWKGKVGKLDKKVLELAEKSRTLAGILRAYPKNCHMQFKSTDQKVLIKETFGHIVWTNDWNEQSIAIAPVSPLLSFASKMKYPLELPKQLIDSGIPTMVGPYCYVKGSTVQYSLPVPPITGQMYLRPSNPDKLADYIAAKITQKPSPQKLKRLSNLAPWIRWTSRAAGLTLMNDSQRKDFIDSWRIILEAAFKPYAWHLRTEPWSGAKYIYSFAWLHRTGRTFGDINSGHGAILYAADLYARCSGDWDLIRKNWHILQAVQQYYQVHHDWSYMQPPCHESSGDSAYDMEIIGYLGAVGFLRMAEKLNKKDDIALGRLFVARFAVPFCMRWLGAMWIAPDKSKPDALPFSSPGLTDSKGFVNGQVKHWLIGLSLAWKGSCPEAFKCQIWGLGKEFWKYLEYDLIEKMKPPFRTEKSWYRPKNVAAHMYMRGLLGASAEELKKELLEQKGCLGATPSTIEAKCHASAYAMAIGKEFPVVLKDWGTAALLSGTYDKAENKAVLKFSCKQAFKVILGLGKSATSCVINGKKGDGLSKGDAVQLNVPAGESIVELFFN